MADGVAITAGSGTTILTDDTGATGHAQVMKLAISTDASPTLIPADTANGLDVDVTRVGGTVAVGDATNGVFVHTSSGDAESNTVNRLCTEAHGMLFNGTTWDRVRGDTTNGLDVDVTRVTGTVTTAESQVIADNAGFTDGTSKVLMAGFVFDETAGTALTENDAAAARVDSKRAQVLTLEDGTTRGQRASVNASGQVAVAPDTVGASTMNASSSDGATALTSTAQAIKASAGVLKGYYIYNPNAAAVYVQFYNTAQGSVTVGTTNPLFMLTIPAGSAANLWTEGGIAFGTAMSWSATSTAGGNGAPTTALDAVCFYK